MNLEAIKNQLTILIDKYFPQTQSVYADACSYTLPELVYYLLGVCRDVLQNSVELTEEFTELKELVDRFMNDMSGEIQAEIINVLKSDEYFLGVIIPRLEEVIDNNLTEMVSRIVKYIFFGLSDDGYFIAKIPYSWDFVKFETDVNPESENYGHLILNY